MAEAVPYRLPRNVTPERYEIRVTPDLDAGTFEGFERVAVRVHEATSTVVLNAIELDIAGAAVVATDGARQECNVEIIEAEEQLVLRPGDELSPGEYSIEIGFNGSLSEKLSGFYRSTYQDEDDVERVIATTQFEPTDARRAFPCWDEPDLKAVFSITLSVAEGLTALSNYEVVSEVARADGGRDVTFADSMKMSSYIVAFVVGPLSVTAERVVDGIPLRIACVPGKVHLTEFALETGEAALRYFTGYFDIPYPGTKLDLIALPDFAFGAMENLGCVTFRENALLVDKHAASRVELERVADVIAHEIAHMWFGDLVTMKWWNGIWLNEAFATFMELLCVDHMHPEWKRWQGHSSSRASAMLTDGLSATRPVEFPVNRPEEAEGMFDVLTYQKGASLLRMLEQFIGAEPFRKGISHYLNQHKHGNAQTADLWHAIEEASGEPMYPSMDTWIYQGGYPVVSVDISDDGTELRLSQERFTYLPAAEECLWHVPLRIRLMADDQIEHRKVLLTETSTVIPLPGKVDWVVANDGGSGFYRVRYTSVLLARLGQSLYGNLDELERFSLVNDTWAAVLAGHAPVSDFTQLAEIFQDESDVDVWAAVLEPFELLQRAVDGSGKSRIQAFVKRLANPALERVGWSATPDESERTATLRAYLIRALGTIANDSSIQERARELHEAYLADRNSVDANLVGAIVATVAENGTESDYEAFWDRVHHPATPQEEMKYLYSLARFSNPALLDRTLNAAINGEIRTQNAPYVIGYALSSREGAQQAWNFLKQNWDQALERFPDNSIGRMIEGVGSQADDELLPDVRAFFQSHPVPQSEKLIDQTIERLEVNALFARRSGAAIAALFDE